MTKRRKHQAIAATEDTLIRCIRAKGRLSRGELAEMLELVPSTVGVYVERLVRDGFLRETVREERGIGRPPVLLELNPASGRFIGIDFDARHVIGVATDFSQNILQRSEREFAELPSVAEALEAFATMIEEFIGASPDDIQGIGVGLPWLVDHEAGVGRWSTYLKDWVDVPVVQWLQERFQKPVWVENTLRSMTLAEYWLGRGRGVQRLACLGSRTGIALGIVLDGALYRGATESAGEIGLWTCPDVMLHGDGRGSLAMTHQERTVQEVASLSALLHEVVTRLERGELSSIGAAGVPPTVESFLQGVAQGDPLAGELMTRAAIQHAWIVYQVTLVLDPDLIVLVGPLIDAPTYLQTILQTCAQWDENFRADRVTTSELGRFAGAIGAVSVAMQGWTPRQNGLPSTGEP